MKGYSSDMLMTYCQAREFGGHVREGESGSVVVYTGTKKIPDRDESGEDVEKMSA
jgi:antirestriction protein ArdC